MDSALATLLRDEAERLAREAFDAHSAAEAACRPWVTAYPWEYLAEKDRDIYVSAHLALLLDLRRPESFEHLKRFVGERVGLDVSGGVMWEPTKAPTDGGFECGWNLVVRRSHHIGFYERLPGCLKTPAGRRCTRLVPGVAVDDSAEALTRAALAVAGATP